MYPWHESFRSWAKGTGLKIDALGLVTLLGAEEMDRSIGRLMPSDYFDYLPLLGAFVVAGDRFTEKKTGYTLYNVSAGIITTELAGWVSRWIRAQNLYKVRSKVTWEVMDRPQRWTKFFFGLLLISVPLHGILLAMTVLAADWWGFANVVSMVVSVAVRCFQVSENQAGIDANINAAHKEAQSNMSKYEQQLKEFEERDHKGAASEQTNTCPPSEPNDYHIAKVLMVTEDSKIVTLVAPNFLVKSMFTAAPSIPNRLLYLLCRSIGWIAFAVHVISIGMAELPTQICSVVLIIVATVLTAYKVGCGDSKIWRSIQRKLGRENIEHDTVICWVTSKLKATISSYPEEWSLWEEDEKKKGSRNTEVIQGSTPVQGTKSSQKTFVDIESLPREIRVEHVKERRQDLYAWLDLTEEQDQYLIAWGLIPHNTNWQSIYVGKKNYHRKRQMTGEGSRP